MGKRAPVVAQRREEHVRVHVDESGDDVASAEVVNVAAGRDGSRDRADARTLDDDRTVGECGAAAGVDYSDVVEDKKGRGEHRFRVAKTFGRWYTQSFVSSHLKGP
jgi:hypothetical protein